MAINPMNIIIINRLNLIANPQLQHNFFVFIISFDINQPIFLILASYDKSFYLFKIILMLIILLMGSFYHNQMLLQIYLPNIMLHEYFVISFY